MRGRLTSEDDTEKIGQRSFLLSREEAGGERLVKSFWRGVVGTGRDIGVGVSVIDSVALASFVFGGCFGASFERFLIPIVSDFVYKTGGAALVRGDCFDV